MYPLLGAGPENGVTLALAEPVTGRTRQIRAHFASVSGPLLRYTVLS